jgi:hypothetical protein
MGTQINGELPVSQRGIWGWAVAEVVVTFGDSRAPPKLLTSSATRISSCDAALVSAKDIAAEGSDYVGDRVRSGAGPQVYRALQIKGAVENLLANPT